MKIYKYFVFIGIVIILVISTFTINNKDIEDMGAISFIDYNYDQAIIKVDKRVLTLAPLNYDGDAHDEFKDKIFTLKLADNVEYYEYIITTVKENGTSKKDYIYNEIDEKKAFDQINDNGAVGYIFVIDNRVTRIVFHGETYIQK